MKRIPALLLSLCLMWTAAPALGEDVLTVQEISGASYVSDREYLRISCPLAGECQVVVTVTDGSGSITYQRDYGVCSGTFHSEDIFLRLTDSGASYQVSVDAGGEVSAFTVERTMPRLTGAAACAVGYPLSSLSGSGSWQTATLLDVNSLSGSGKTVAMHASGAYDLGTVTFSVSGGALTVNAAIGSGIDGEIDSATVYVATTAAQAQNLGTRNFSGATGKLGQAIDLGGSSYAAVYVQLTVSFDPADAPGSPETSLDGQEELWMQMQETVGEAVG